MKSLLLVSVLLIYCVALSAQQNDSTRIYLIPGQGSDYRIFSELEFPERYVIKYVNYELPLEGERMPNYAKRLVCQIDTTSPFILVGVSLGGMIAVEMAEQINPEQVIIIASAKNRDELPGRYTFQKRIPIYKIVWPGLSKAGAKILQPIVEPDRKKREATFKAMLEDKDPLFLSRTIEMIILWERNENHANVIHVHGDHDRTIPLRNVTCDFVVPDGSHMMTLTRPREVSKILSRVLQGGS